MPRTILIGGALLIAACAPRTEEHGASLMSECHAYGDGSGSGSGSACGDPTPGPDAATVEDGGGPTDAATDGGYPECSACDDEAAEVAAITDEQAAKPNRTYEEDLATCYLVGKLPWEDEDADGQTDDTAINCRDFTRWFVECMSRLGHDAEGLSMYCKNCDSGSSKGHAIAVYEKPDGSWCPGEPQRETGGEWSECCKGSKAAASQCALEKHCGGHAKRDACCEPKKRKPYDCSDEKCRLIIDVDGVEYLNCDLGDGGVISIDGGPEIPKPKPIDRDDSKACRDAIKECLAQEDLGTCEDCRRDKLDECKPKYQDCKDKSTNSACTACCNASGDFQDCATFAGCAGKPFN